MRNEMAVPNVGFLGTDHRDPDAVALIDDPSGPGERTWTWGRLDGLANAHARRLNDRGLVAGDRVALMGRNSAHYVAALLGAMRAGLVPVPVNVKLPPRTVTHILTDSGARVVLHDERFADSLGTWNGPRVALEEVENDRSAPLEASLTTVDRDAPALQLYTSGSTGAPKGVVLSHAAKAWTLRAYTPPGDGTTLRGIIAAPLYHKNGLLTALLLVGSGGTVALMPAFDGQRYLHAVARHRLNVLGGVPSMFERMLQDDDRIGQLDLDCVRLVMVGSAPLTDSLLARVRAAFPNAVVTNNYGTTEVAAVFGPHPDGKPRPANSLGALLPGTEARLVDGVGPDEGRLEVRNPSVMLGYHGLPELTRDRLRDGWYDTGDVMRRDADGFYYFVGRSDDMFVCNGENVYPAQVESLLARHPSVRDVAVVAVPDDRRGAVPVAYVVSAHDAAVSEEDLRGFALTEGPAYAHPRAVIFVDELPLSGTGKVDRQELTRRAREVRLAEPGSEPGIAATGS